MSLFSFHLARASISATAGALLRPPEGVRGLRHAEHMAVMTLGAPILSPQRMQMRRLAVFAWWACERALEDFLAEAPLGRTLAAGWHVRLQLVRRWGHVSELDDGAEMGPGLSATEPVVAVTLARLKLTQTARFVRWGKPVEEAVRDHPGATLALAAMRPPRTFSTFTVWRTQADMLDMVRGQSASPSRHARAMAERTRKDFHHQFTTMRFRALGEHGAWEGRTGIVPR